MIRLTKFVLGAAALILSLSASSAALDVPKDSLWFYLPFDGSLQGYPKERVINVIFGKDEDELRKEKPSIKPLFVAGKSGEGVDLPPDNLLSYMLDTSEFPLERGSIVVWVKPHEDLSPGQNNFILEVQWASFELRTGAAYCSSSGGDKAGMIFDPRKFKFTWKDNWHLYVMTWDGEKRAVYLDGEKLVDRSGVPVNKSMSPGWVFGYLPSCPGRPPCAFVNATLDDFAVLSEPLNQKQVETIWSNPGQSLPALLGANIRMELPRKVFVRGESIPLKFKCECEADEIRLSVSDAEGNSYPLGTLKPSKESFAIDSNLLRPGKLRLRAELIKGQALLDSATLDIVLHQFRGPEFPIGVGGGINADSETLDYLQKNHVSFMTGNGPPQNFRAALDKWYARGIAYFPNLNILSLWQNGYAFNHVKEEPYFRYDKKSRQWHVDRNCREYLQTVVPIGGKTEDGGTSSASPFSEVAFGMMSKVIKEYLEMAGDHPGWQYVSFQDEVPLRFGSYDPLSKLKDSGWKDEWHCFVMTWKDGRREIFFDGKLVASADNIPVPGSISSSWAFAYLPGDSGREAGGFANSVFDDVAVLSKALSEEEVATLWLRKDENLTQLAAKISDLLAL